jgi:hypothetical protein
MAAIVTETYKKDITSVYLDLVNNSADSNQYHIGIGKSDTYNVSDNIITPVRTFLDERNLRNNLQSVKKVENASLVIPRYNWTSGNEFTAFSDSVVGIPANSYYVLTDANEVYICIKSAKNSSGAIQISTVKPSYIAAGVASTQAFETSDGYVWKYMYELTAARAAAFLTSNWLPVQFIDSAVTFASATDETQYNVQEAAVKGQIVGIRVTENGSGYTSTPTITIRGNGSGAVATATVNNNQITKIDMNNESAGLGSGYDFAQVIISGGGGTGAVAKPIIAPYGGIGADPRRELKASNIMFNIKPDGNVNETFLVGEGRQFRQIGLFKNIRYSDSAVAGHIYDGVSSRTLRHMQMASVAGAADFAADIGGLLQDASSPPIKAFIDDIDSDFIYFHQNDSSGFGVFTNGSTITSASGNSTVDEANLFSLVNPYSGDLIYSENRAAISRTSSQQEDIKIIITV